MTTNFRSPGVFLSPATQRTLLVVQAHLLHKHSMEEVQIAVQKDTASTQMF